MIEKQAFYRTLNQQAQALLEGEPDLIANLANLSALLNQELADINWVGFYLLQGETLVLGPFQGKPACVRIPVGRGVCGTAVAEGKTQLVDDVHQFTGHIACDGARDIYVGGYEGFSAVQPPKSLLTIKYSATGARKWVRAWSPGSGWSAGYPAGLVLDSKGGVDVGSYAESKAYGHQAVLLKYQR